MSLSAPFQVRGVFACPWPVRGVLRNSCSGQRLAGTVTFHGHSQTFVLCRSRGVSPAIGQHLALPAPDQRLKGAFQSLSASILCATSRANVANVSDARPASGISRTLCCVSPFSFSYAASQASPLVVSCVAFCELLCDVSCVTEWHLIRS